MPLDWKNYDSYFDGSVKQPQLPSTSKQALEEELSSMLRLDEAVRPSVWGECTQPGCYGLTVIHLPASLRHRWNPDAQKAIGLKVFHLDGFGGRKAEPLVKFHLEVRPRYPGLPQLQVQEVLDGGQLACCLPDESGKRWYLIQEWIEGETWDQWLESRDISPDHGVELLQSLFGGIILPLWSRGVIWWDIRAGNYCVRRSGKGHEVVMIDTDSLEAYHKEILETPADHSIRDAKKGTGVKRLRTMIDQLSKAVMSRPNPTARTRAATKASSTQEVADFLQRLSSPGALDHPKARSSLDRMVNHLRQNLWRD